VTKSQTKDTLDTLWLTPPSAVWYAKRLVYRTLNGWHGAARSVQAKHRPRSTYGSAKRASTDKDVGAAALH